MTPPGLVASIAETRSSRCRTPSSARCAQTGARRVDHHPIVGAGLLFTNLATVTGADHDLEAGVDGRVKGLSDQVRAVFADLVCEQGRAALRAKGRQQCRLSAGSCAQVQPLL